jgi:hypothetical protein
MPIISYFFGIYIKMFFDDHNPPHFHAEYGDDSAEIRIKTGEVVSGNLPNRALRIIEEWRQEHIDELMEDWELAKNDQLPKKIKPLE